MKELVGRKINSLFVNDGESILAFETDNGIIAYKTYGDCCSETWFADIIGTESILGEIILETEFIEVNCVNDGRSRQEEDEFYGVALKTRKGACDIIYRNSSNGYYCGDIYLMENSPEVSGFKKVTQDWSA